MKTINTTILQANAVNQAIKRIMNNDHFAFDANGKYVIIEGLDGREYQLSCRIGEALEVLKKARGYYLLNADADHSIRQAIDDTASQFGLTRGTIVDKITRQLGGVSAAVCIDLFRDALTSKEKKLDDLLSLLRDCRTETKDEADEITKAYGNV